MKEAILDWLDGSTAKWVFMIIAIGLVVTACFFIDWSSKEKVVHTEPQIQTEIWGSGRIEGISEDIYLGFLDIGRVSEIKVHDGSKVKSGDVLIILDNKQEQNRLSLARNNKRLFEAQLVILQNGAHKFEKAQAKALCDAKLQEIDFARGDFDRKYMLHKDHKAVSMEEVELARTTLNALIYEYNKLKANYDLLEAPAREDKVEEARARIAIAEDEIAVVEEVLSRTTLRSPVDGEILSVDIELGEYVSPQLPVLVMADTSAYRVRAFFDEYDCLKIEPGMAARMKADSSDTVFIGKISSLGRRMTTKEIITNHPTEVMDTKVREVWVDIEDFDPKEMVVGLRVDVVVELDQGIPVSTTTETFYSR